MKIIEMSIPAPTSNKIFVFRFIAILSSCLISDYTAIGLFIKRNKAMKKHISALFAVGVLVLGACVATRNAAGADTPYNDNADASLQIHQALTRAAAAKTSVIVVFGANWCPDCRELDHAMKNGDCAALMTRDFQIVNVSVGRFNKNLDVAKSYGVPLAKGIPAVAILSAQDKVLYITREGELANARDMGDTGIYDFFKRVTASALRP
jgi:protein disulfide-isomerase